MNGDDQGSDEIRERVRAEERQRLSLELHDTVGQTLVLARLQLNRMLESLNQPPDAARQIWLYNMLTSLIPEIDAALQMVQTATFTLYSACLTEVGLVATLEKECAAFTHRTGVPCEGRFERLALEAKQGESVVVILREALCNIVRHAGASNVYASLQRSGERVVLAIRDNGIGIDRSHMKATMNLGLRSIEERARTLGGAVTIEGIPHEGTAITVSFPLSRAHPSLSGQ